MQTIFRRYFPQRSFSLQVFCYCLKLRLRTVLRITISLLKCRCSLRLVQGSPFSYTASIDSNSSSCFALTHFSFSAGLRSSQSIRCAYFPSGHSYAPSLIDSVSLFSLSLKKGAYQPGFILGSKCVCINFARKGDMVLQIMAYFAQADCESIRQRQAEGIAAVKATGNTQAETR